MTLPPVNFTPAEALAVTAALAAAEHSAPFAGSARSAVRKVAAVLSGPASAAARDLARQIVAMPSRADPAVRAGVEQAIADGRVLRLGYRGADGQASERVVEPAGLLTAQGQWYLVAWCRLRAAPRGFRLDRILSATVTEETAPPRRLADMLGPAAAQATPPGSLDALT